MKLRPHAKVIEKRVAMSNTHLYGPGTINIPNTKSIQIIAPAYTGPEVNAFSPQ